MSAGIWILIIIAAWLTGWAMGLIAGYKGGQKLCQPEIIALLKENFWLKVDLQAYKITYGDVPK